MIDRETTVQMLRDVRRMENQNEDGTGSDIFAALSSLIRAAKLLERAAYELAGTASLNDTTQLILMSRDVDRIADDLREGMLAQKN